MIAIFIRSKIPKIIRFIHLQLFITLICIPIFALWGLPISILSLAGNLFFSPFLSLFLLLSFFIFSCEIIGIPNSIFITALECTTNAWQWCLDWHGSLPLMGFTQPSLITAIAILLSAFALLASKQGYGPFRNCCILLICIMACCIFLRPPTTVMYTLSHGKKQLHIFYYQGTTILIDNGMLGKSISCESWVRYTLLPELLKKTGSTNIDHCIALNVTGRSFTALTTLCTITNVSTIYIPYWKGFISYSSWKAFKTLLALLSNKNISLIRLGDQHKAITINTSNALSLKPSTRHKKYNDASYNLYQVSRIIDNSTITLYDP